MPLTPEQFRSARHALGLSAAQLSKELGVSARTVFRWESETKPIKVNPMAERLIRSMLADAGYRPDDWPKET